MSEIQQNRYDQLIRRVADLKGPGSKVSWALGDLLPVIDIENVRNELLVLMGTRLAWGGDSLAAGAAGEFNHIQVANPAGSGFLVSLDKVLLRTDASQDFQVNIEANLQPDPATVAPVFTDTRVATEGTVGKVFTGTDMLTQAGQIEIAKRNVNSSLIVELPVVLSPGFALTITNGTAATELLCYFFWRERAAQPSELNI